MSIACLREPLEGSRSPRYLYSVAIEIVTPFSTKHLEPRVLRRVKQTILVFFKLTFKFQVLQNSANPFSDLWSPSGDSERRTRSSAKIKR